MEEGNIPKDTQKKQASIVKRVVMTTFGLILMAVFAFVAVLAKPLDPVKRAISEDMRDKKNAQPEKEEVEPKTKKSSTLVQHIMVTLLAVAIMGFFALITVMAKPLDPIKRAISDFSFTDVYYEIRAMQTPVGLLRL